MIFRTSFDSYSCPLAYDRPKISAGLSHLKPRLYLNVSLVSTSLLSSSLMSKRNFNTKSEPKPLCSKFTCSKPIILTKYFSTTKRKIPLGRLFSTKKDNSKETNFSAKIKHAKNNFFSYLKRPNLDKANEIFYARLRQIGVKYSLDTKDTSDLESKWSELQQIIKKCYDVELPEYDKDLYTNISNIHNCSWPMAFHERKQLSQIAKVVDDRFQSSLPPHQKQLTLTTTDDYWFLYPPAIPFTQKDNINSKVILSNYQYIYDQLPRSIQKLLPLKSECSTDQELMDTLLSTEQEDAFAIYMLLLSELDENTALHEIGCWNGTNLINIAFYALLKDRALSGCLGTDINKISVNFGNTLIDLLRLPKDRLKLGLSHVLAPINIQEQGIPYKKQIKLLLRVIPVMDESFIRRLFEQFKGTLNQQDVIGLSYALQEGKTYERNILRVEKELDLQHKFKEGITFFNRAEDAFGSLEYRNKKIIVNTYFSEEGFRSLAAQYDFDILHHLKVGKNSDNARGVCLLKKKKN